jgi:Flp pilus assembly secretin CpaC
MATLSGRRPIRSRLGTALAVGLIATLIAAPRARSDSGTITVVIDQAQLLKLPDRISTLVIGNPLIVDAALQPGGIIVLTGKGFGTTNMMALDRAGNVLMERSIRVRTPKDTVVVYRGIERQTYNCAPNCEPQIALGDSEAGFNLTLGQTTARNAQAQGAAR